MDVKQIYYYGLFLCMRVLRVCVFVCVFFSRAMLFYSFVPFINLTKVYTYTNGKWNGMRIFQQVKREEDCTVYGAATGRINERKQLLNLSSALILPHFQPSRLTL